MTLFKRIHISKDPANGSPDILGEFIRTQEEVTALPQLSNVEKVQFEHDIAIGHLYYSSKIEGSHLDEERLNNAIHAA
jgi:hypothetical protein